MKILTSLWTKVIAVLLVFTMVVQDAGFANQGAMRLPSATLPPLSYLSQEIGRVDEIQIRGNGKTPWIYHIQDAHAVYDAQANLARILETLIRKENISLVLVEGGSGTVSLTALRKVAAKSVRSNVAERFLRQGKIAGEEYLQLASDYALELVGIEDEALYRENAEVYLKALRRKEAALKNLSQIEGQIRTLQAKLYPAEFRELERMRERWQDGEGDLLQYLFQLRTRAEKKKIETASFAEWNKLSNPEKGIAPSGFDQSKFFRELTEIENKVRSEFLTDAPAKRLFQISETIRLLRKLFSLELTSDEFEGIRNNPASYDAGKLAAELETISGNHFFGNLEKAAAFLEKEKDVFLKFYDLAGKRDHAFIKNIERILREKHPKKAVLITGGFHSKHLGELFEAKGISRALISPAIPAIEKNAGKEYERMLREKLKSALRMPATLGSPIYPALRQELERAQRAYLDSRIRDLISFLDIDRFLGKKDQKEVQTSPKQQVSLLAQMLQRWNQFVSQGNQPPQPKTAYSLASDFGIVNRSEVRADDKRPRIERKDGIWITFAHGTTIENDEAKGTFKAVTPQKTKVEGSSAYGAVEFETQTGLHATLESRQTFLLLGFRFELPASFTISFHTDGRVSMKFPDMQAEYSQEKGLFQFQDRSGKLVMSEDGIIQGMNLKLLKGGTVKVQDGKFVLETSQITQPETASELPEKTGEKVHETDLKKPEEARALPKNTGEIPKTEAPAPENRAEPQKGSKEVPLPVKQDPLQTPLARAAEAGPAALGNELAQGIRKFIANAKENKVKAKVDAIQERLKSLREEIVRMGQEQENLMNALPLTLSPRALWEKLTAIKKTFDESMAPKLEAVLPEIEDFKTAANLRAYYDDLNRQYQALSQIKSQMLSKLEDAANQKIKQKANEAKRQIDDIARSIFREAQKTKKDIEDIPLTQKASEINQRAEALEETLHQRISSYFVSIQETLEEFNFPELNFIFSDLTHEISGLERSILKHLEEGVPFAEKIPAFEEKASLPTSERSAAETQKTPELPAKSQISGASLEGMPAQPAELESHEPIGEIPAQETAVQQEKVSETPSLEPSRIAERTRIRLRKETIREVIQENENAFPVFSLKAFRKLLERSGKLNAYHERYGHYGLSDPTLRKDLTSLGLLNVKPGTQSPIGRRAYYFHPDSGFTKTLPADDAEKMNKLLEKGKEADQALDVGIPVREAPEKETVAPRAPEPPATKFSKDEEALTQRTEEMKTLLSRLRLRARELIGVIRSLEPAKDRLTKEMEGMRTLHDSIAASNQELARQRDDISAKLELLKSDFAAKSIDYSTLQTEFDALKKKLDELAQTKAGRDTEVEALESRVKDLTDQIASLEAQVKTKADQAQKDVRQYEERIGSLQNELAEKLELKRKAEREIEDRGKITDIAQDLQVLELQKNRLAQEIGLLEEELKSLTQVRDQIKKETEELLQALKSLGEQKNALHEEITQFKATRDELQRDTQQLKEELESLKNQSRTAHAAAHKARYLEFIRKLSFRAMAEDEEKLRELENALLRIDSEAGTETNPELARLKDEAHEALRLVQDSVTQDKNEKRKKADLAQKETDFLGALQTLTDLDRLDRFEEELSSLKTRFSGLDFDPLGDDIERVRSKVLEKETIRLDKERKMSSAENAFKALSERLRKLTGANEEGEISAIQAELEKMTSLYADLLEALHHPERELERGILDIRSKISEAKKLERNQKLMSAKQKFDSLLQEITQVSGSAEEMEIKLKEFQARFQALEPELKQFEEDLNVSVGKIRTEFFEATEKIEKARQRERAPPAETMQEKLKKILQERVSPGFWQHLSAVFHLSKSDIETQLLARLKEAGPDSPFARVIELIETHGSVSKGLEGDKQYAGFKDLLKRLGVNSGFDESGNSIPFSAAGENYNLVLSEGNAEDLIRGYLSGDCTNCALGAMPPVHPESPFNQYLTKHLLSPDFLNFRVINSRGAWVGNIYAFVARREGKPILFLEAFQLPWNGITHPDGMELPQNLRPDFMIPDQDVASQIMDEAVKRLVLYAGDHHFMEVWAGFVSNFYPLAGHFQRTYHDAYRGAVQPFRDQNYSGDPALSESGPDAYQEKQEALDFEFLSLFPDEIDSFNYRRGFARLWQYRVEPTSVRLDQEPDPRLAVLQHGQPEAMMRALQHYDKNPNELLASDEISTALYDLVVSRNPHVQQEAARLMGRFLSERGYPFYEKLRFFHHRDAEHWLMRGLGLGDWIDEIISYGDHDVDLNGISEDRTGLRSLLKFAVKSRVDDLKTEARKRLEAYLKSNREDAEKIRILHESAKRLGAPYARLIRELEANVREQLQNQFKRETAEDARQRKWDELSAFRERLQTNTLTDQDRNSPAFALDLEFLMHAGHGPIRQKAAEILLSLKGVKIAADVLLLLNGDYDYEQAVGPYKEAKTKGLAPEERPEIGLPIWQKAAALLLTPETISIFSDLYRASVNNALIDRNQLMQIAVTGNQEAQEMLRKISDLDVKMSLIRVRDMQKAIRGRDLGPELVVPFSKQLAVEFEHERKARELDEKEKLSKARAAEKLAKLDKDLTDMSELLRHALGRVAVKFPAEFVAKAEEVLSEKGLDSEVQTVFDDLLRENGSLAAFNVLLRAADHASPSERELRIRSIGRFLEDHKMPSELGSFLASLIQIKEGKRAAAVRNFTEKNKSKPYVHDLEKLHDYYMERTRQEKSRAGGGLLGRWFRGKTMSFLLSIAFAFLVALGSQSTAWAQSVPEEHVPTTQSKEEARKPKSVQGQSKKEEKKETPKKDIPKYQDSASAASREEEPKASENTGRSGVSSSSGAVTPKVAEATRPETFDALVKKLESTYWSPDRKQAIEALGNLKDKRSIPVLLKYLENREVNAAAALALVQSGYLTEADSPGKITDVLGVASSFNEALGKSAYMRFGAQAIPAIIRLSEMGDKQNTFAVTLLNELHNTRSEQILAEYLKLLESAEEKNRLLGIKLLDQTHHYTPGLDRVLKLVGSDPSWSVRSQGALFLVNFEKYNQNPAVITISAIQRGKKDKETWNDRVVRNWDRDGLLFILKEAPADEAQLAKDALVLLKEPRAIAILKEIYQSNRWNYSSPSALKALDELGAIGASTDLSFLMTVLSDSSSALSSVHSKAREAAVRLVRSKADQLNPFLNHDEWKLRKAAVEVLGAFGERSAIPKLIERTGDKDSDVRFASAEALGRLDDGERTRTALFDLANRDKTNAGDRALILLYEKGYFGPGLEKLSDPVLIARLFELKPEAKRAASRSVLERLEKVLRNKPDETGLSHANAAKLLNESGDSSARQILISNLSSTDPSTRYAAIQILGDMRSTSFIPPLKELLFSSDWTSRKLSAQALEKIPGGRAIREVEILLGILACDSKRVQTRSDYLIASLKLALSDSEKNIAQFATGELARYPEALGVESVGPLLSQI